MGEKIASSQAFKLVRPRLISYVLCVLCRLGLPMRYAVPQPAIGTILSWPAFSHALNRLQDTTPPVMAFAGTPGSNVPAPAVALPAGSSAEATSVLTWGASDASTVTFACKLTGTGTSSLQRQVFFGAVNSAPVSGLWAIAAVFLYGFFCAVHLSSGSAPLHNEVEPSRAKPTWRLLAPLPAPRPLPQLTLGASYNCTSPQTFHWLLPGQWGFEVVGTDAAGNAAAPLSLAWAVAFDSAKQYTRLYRCKEAGAGARGAYCTELMLGTFGTYIAIQAASALLEGCQDCLSQMCRRCPLLARPFCSGLFGLVPGIPATFEFAVLKLTGGSLAAVGGAATLCWLESNSSERRCLAAWGQQWHGTSLQQMRKGPGSCFPVLCSATARTQGALLRTAPGAVPAGSTPDWQACTSPKSYGTLPDGAYK